MQYLKKVPRKYEDEFLKKQAEFIRTRVRLLCGLVIGIYFSLSLASFILLPKQVELQEFYVWGSFVLGGILVLSLNRRAKTITESKRNAYLFTVLSLLILIRVNILNPGQISIASLIYLFVLFLVSFTIPWSPLETIPITFIHVGAYSYLYFYVQHAMPLQVRAEFSWPAYLTGLMFFFTAFVLVLIIREKETEREIENFVLLKDLEAKNIQMENELELATKVHQTLVPKSIETDVVDIAVMYLPISYIGGDYARFHFVNKDRLIFIICDVTGHGVSAALLVNRLHSEFERLAEEGREPGILLKELNNFIIREFQGSNMYISAFCGLMDFRTKSFTYSNYAHPTQYFYKAANSQIIYLGSQTTLLGLSSAYEEIHQHQIDFERGNKLFMFTDGVTEARGYSDEEYGKQRLENFIKRHHGLKPVVFNRRLLEELTAFKSQKKFKDDIFILTVEIK
jgi:sigma-B regulation protein RsbU (phosphoserine phosphatase)